MDYCQRTLFFSQFHCLRLVKTQTNISPRLRKTFNFFLPSLLTIICVETIKYSLESFLNTSFLFYIATSVFQSTSFSDIQELILYKGISLLTWIVGLHGEYTADGIFNLIQEVPTGKANGIDLKKFHDVFMNIGGSGSTFAIPFIILLTRQTQYLKSIARLSLPFIFVNVNEILLFGLPIILNPIFIIPFFLAPFINMLIVFSAMGLGLFDIDLTAPVYWISPPLYSAYIISKGSIVAVLTQLFCIILDGLIYLPFIRLANHQYQTPSSLTKFFHKEDDAYSFLNEEMSHHEERLFVTKQQNTLTNISAAQQVLRQLKGGQLLLYFQPKFDAKTLSLRGMEALLRFQDEAGKIFPPNFLSVLYTQGLSKTIDRKVTDLVFEQFQKWQQLGLTVPIISINFDKDFLLDPKAVQTFINRAKRHKLYFYIEITEHTYTVQLDALTSVTKKLRRSGHKISIDDFGAGYSSLTSLLTLDADEIKLDRKLVTPPKGELARGHILLKSSIKLCHALGFCVVAEGVETASQLSFLQECGVDTVQGYYLGKPMPPKRIAQLFPTN
ncbi:MAG: PTS sugar transporter subunit IIC/EAL domain-containing protein [Leptolyngbya sp. SIO3F4]|nr:PTS sugar transporter subunit IIC/EAL domain-containing protein [Leptolyngbya sp. SIO3F4]